jgi:hypothetical protein
MTVGAKEVPVISLVVKRGINNEVWIHPFLDGPVRIFIVIIIGLVTMAFETFLVLFCISEYLFILAVTVQ